MKTHHLVAAALLICGYASQSAAYNFIEFCGSTPARWPGSSQTFSAAAVSFPSGGPFLGALQTVMSRVNEPINFSIGVVTGDTSVAIGNGQSEVWFSSDPSFSPAVAFTFSTCSGGSRLTEADVVFYNGEPYTTNMTLTGLFGYGGGSRPFETTATHEFGHAINLHHVNTEYNIMGQDYFHLHGNGGTARSYLGEDAADGAIFLYGSNGRQDLSVVHWKRIGASGQYSTHGRTRLYNTSGSELFFTTVGGDPRWDVRGGQAIQVELTAENNGASAHNARIGFYLSTNSTITTSDTLITNQFRTVRRDNVDTYRATVTLPSGLASADYWLGAIIDDNNVISESSEGNNATYWRVRYTR